MADTEGNNNPQTTGQPATSTTAGGRKKPPVALMVGGVVAVVALIYGVKSFMWNRHHVSTDDAYVMGDLVTISPKVSGTLDQILVREGDIVHRGQVVARLGQVSPQATLRQARANYEAAITMVPQAERNLEYQQRLTEAATKKARASLAAQQARAGGARQQVSLTSATYQNQVRQAQAQVAAAQAQRQQFDAQVQSALASKANYAQAVETARAALANVEQQVQTAQRALQAARARATAAKAEADRAAKDEARFRTLYSEDAVSAQAYDSARATAQNLAAQATAARSEVEVAASQAESARRAADQARSQVTQAQKAVDQASAQVVAAQKAADAAGQQVQVAQAGLGLARANGTQVGIQESNLTSTSQQVGETEADVASAEAGQSQVAVRKTQIETYRAQARQAAAALVNAEETVNDTVIKAPTDGEVVRKDANAGQTVAPGTALLTMTQGHYLWVDANFKETQLADVEIGQEAEIEVDAFPGKTFKGRVQSIRHATGATTALLPPDNATGNFTKVVQRIAVRIEFEATENDGHYATQKDLDELRQGMSVTATIDTSEKGDPSKVKETPNATALDSDSLDAGTTAGGGNVSTPSDATMPTTATTPGMEPSPVPSTAGAGASATASTTAGTSGAAPAPSAPNPGTPSDPTPNAPKMPPPGNPGTTPSNPVVTPGKAPWDHANRGGTGQ